MNNNMIYERAQQRGKQLFINPETLYTYEEIINGIQIGKKVMQAVDESTFMAFGFRFNENAKNVMKLYKEYFINNKEYIVEKLKCVCCLEDMDNLEKELYDDIYSRLMNSKAENTDSYNRIRKPINLYLEHIISMCDMFGNSERERIIPYMFVSMDSQIFKCEYIFTKAKRKEFGLKKGMGFGAIKKEEVFYKIQEFLLEEAERITKEIGQEFYRIYFDVFWRNRLESKGENLFLSNLKVNIKKTKETENKGDEIIYKLEIDEEYIKNIFNKSEKTKFRTQYEKKTFKLKYIFYKLVKECSEFCGEHRVTDTKNGDYRFDNGINFCLLTFSGDSIKIEVLTYGENLNSDEMKLKFDGKIHRGRGWYVFYINNLEQVDEAVRLIKLSSKIVYSRSK